MYSPAARPSSERAAPAKKRRLSAITGISSALTASIGLPALRASRRAISSPCSSITSAIASSACARCAVDLLGARDGRAGDLLAGGGVEDRFGLAAAGRALAVDEVAEGLCGARHLGSPLLGVSSGSLASLS